MVIGELVIGMDAIQPLQSKIFSFIVKILGYRNQLLMNHWQTTSYSEHKLTDDIIDFLDEIVDKLAENALGSFGRPKINTSSNNISDIGIASTNFILTTMDNELQEIIRLCKEEDHEGLLSLFGELDSSIKKFKYLSTLD